MNLSYWEIKTWLSNVDYTVIGSGIVGLSCALQLKQRYPNANVVIIEKGVLPKGASTKNAGFACFGSLSEIIDDLKTHTDKEVVDLIKRRVDGLRLLRQQLGDSTIDYKNLGGYELFTHEDTQLYDGCITQLGSINKLLRSVFNSDVFSLKANVFGFKNINPNYIYNGFEGQIDTGKMMEALTKIVIEKGIKIFNSTSLQDFSSDADSVHLKTNHFEFSTKKLLIATNGFAHKLLNESVKPARAQVLITKPIPGLSIQGTFHLDRGYYYFRNIDNRILFGGGRHLDFKTEETCEFGETAIIQSKLKELLRTTILPNTEFEIDYTWSGIMGVGQQKKPIIKQIENNVYCGVRLGGMGVAIGSLVGKELADLV